MSCCWSLNLIGDPLSLTILQVCTRVWVLWMGPQTYFDMNVLFADLIKGLRYGLLGTLFVFLIPSLH